MPSTPRPSLHHLRPAAVLAGLALTLAACGASDANPSDADAVHDTSSDLESPPTDSADPIDISEPGDASAPTDTSDAEGDAQPSDGALPDLPDPVDAADPAEVGDTSEPPDSTDTPDTPDTSEPPDSTETPDTADPVDTVPADVDLPDAAVTRQVILPGFCPSTPTAAGYYRGTLANNLNDIAGACGLSAPGRDGALRIELAVGHTVRAVYRHGGDGILYLLDSCPVVGSCLVGADSSSSGEEVLEWTNTGNAMNPIYLILDSDELAGPQTFELDLFITGP